MFRVAMELVDEDDQVWGYFRIEDLDIQFGGWLDHDVHLCIPRYYDEMVDLSRCLHDLLYECGIQYSKGNYVTEEYVIEKIIDAGLGGYILRSYKPDSIRPKIVRLHHDPIKMQLRCTGERGLIPLLRQNSTGNPYSYIPYLNRLLKIINTVIYQGKSTYDS